MQAGNLIFGSKVDYIVAIASCLITLISVMIALYQSCALGQQADMRRRAAHILYTQAYRDLYLSGNYEKWRSSERCAAGSSYRVTL